MSDKFAEKNQSTVRVKAKKPYAAPELQKWGKLSDITKNVGGRGSPDGNRGPRNRTSN